MAADAVDAALSAGDYSASRFSEYGEELTRGIEAKRKPVYCFYDHEFSFAVFVKEFPEMRGDLTECLMGHLSRQFDPMFKAIAKFAAVPEPLAHGAPLIEA
jgi:hypothetical protein